MTHKMSKELSAALSKPFPVAAIQQRPGGGGTKLDYLSTDTVIRRLNRATGNNWSFAVDKVWTEGTNSFALCTLTIPGLGSRQHIGVQSTDSRQGEDAVAKGAVSDSLKKCSTLFGVGLELYGKDFEAEEEAALLSDARKRFRLLGVERGQSYKNPAAVTEHIRELVPGTDEPDLSDVETAISILSAIPKITAKDV